MVILMADYAGFCFGVERAIDIAEKTAVESDSVVTLGPIIHNPQVVENLERKGVHVIKDVSGVQADNTVVVRSHGITKETYAQLQNRNVSTVDATCPFVTKVQRAAEQLSNEGNTVVVVGEADHAEVIGIVSFIPGEYFIVSTPEEAEQLPKRPRIGLVAQTTQQGETFRSVQKILATKTDTLTVVNTICNATTHRQQAARDIAGRADVMIVIGGKNSANTKQLFDICAELCGRSYHIETKEELSPSMFQGANTVGITAGASTPKYLMQEVREYIQEVSEQ